MFSSESPPIRCSLLIARTSSSPMEDAWAVFKTPLVDDYTGFHYHILPYMLRMITIHRNRDDTLGQVPHSFAHCNHCGSGSKKRTACGLWPTVAAATADSPQVTTPCLWQRALVPRNLDKKYQRFLSPIWWATFLGAARIDSVPRCHLDFSFDIGKGELHSRFEDRQRTVHTPETRKTLQFHAVSISPASQLFVYCSRQSLVNQWSEWNLIVSNISAFHFLSDFPSFSIQRRSPLTRLKPPAINGVRTWSWLWWSMQSCLRVQLRSCSNWQVPWSAKHKAWVDCFLFSLIDDIIWLYIYIYVIFLQPHINFDYTSVVCICSYINYIYIYNMI